MNLKMIGYHAGIENDFLQYDQMEYIVGRVSLEHKQLYRVWTESGELLCEVSGKLSYQALVREDLPAVGDWVVVKAWENEDRGTIHAVLPRKSKFSRKVAGTNVEEQIVATNVDTIFLVSALNEDLNVRRIERYLLLTWESGANPVIVLTKADLCADVKTKILEIEEVAIGVPIVCISVFKQTGFEALMPHLLPGKTIALLGSSGVGKSTLTNHLLGEERQKVQEIREDDGKGRHTTTSRELILLPSGSILIDTPGMRELQLWESKEGVSHAFSDVESIAEKCRFRDCHHENEPGCAIQLAIKNNELSEDRFNSYKKLLKELAFLDRKLDKRAQSEEKKRWKKIHKAVKQHSKYK